MKLLKLALMFIAVIIFAIACSQNPATTSNTASTNKNAPATNAPPNQVTPAADELAGAKKIFADKCVQCHKENGEGGQVDIEGDKFKVPSFKDDKVKAGDDKKYTRVIEEGDDKMPAFKKQLKPEEIAQLIKFVRKEFQGK
jgi:mono/diheme cytochrome c family protein